MLVLLQCRADASPWKVLSMLVNIASFAAGRFDPVNWATQLYQGVQSFATGSDPFSNFFGLSPTGVSRNPDSVFVCDCVAACQIMFLRNPASPTDQAKFTQCVGIPGKAQYAGLRGQQAHLQDYIKKGFQYPIPAFPQAVGCHNECQGWPRARLCAPGEGKKHANGD